VHEDSQFFGSLTVKVKAERLTLECLTVSEEHNSQTYNFVWCKTEGLPTNFAPNFIFLTS